MSKLLSANLMRLRRSGLFWGMLAVMAVFGAVMVFQQLWEQVRYAEFGSTGQMDLIFFRYAAVTGLAMAVFIPLFFGAEYSDGTLRNKVMVGHSRRSVYLANWLAGVVVSVLLCVAYLIPVMVLGPVLIEFLTMDIRALTAFLLGTVVMGAAFCSIFVLITMNCSRKAVTAVSCILLVVALMVFAMYINAMLEAPEFVPVYSLVNGEVTSTMEANPRCLRGTARALYEFLYDFLPMGQTVQYSSMSVAHLWRLPLYSAIITLAATAAGVAMFKRKDLK